MNDDIFVKAFLNYISNNNRSMLIKASSISQTLQMEIVDILGRFGCRQLPTTSNLSALLLKAATYEFCIKPAAALVSIYSGIPESHQRFWNERGIDGIIAVYESLSVTSSTVLKALRCPAIVTAEQERVFSYLKDMIGNLQSKELQSFLRFVTGSSSLITNTILVQFNCLSGVARRPIAHTCSCSLELSVQYINYNDFAQEFFSILTGNQQVWEMNSV